MILVPLFLFCGCERPGDEGKLWILRLLVLGNSLRSKCKWAEIFIACLYGIRTDSSFLWLLSAKTRVTDGE